MHIVWKLQHTICRIEGIAPTLPTPMLQCLRTGSGPSTSWWLCPAEAESKEQWLTLMMLEWGPDPAPNVGTIEKTPQAQRSQTRAGSILEGCLRKYQREGKVAFTFHLELSHGVKNMSCLNHRRGTCEKLGNIRRQIFGRPKFQLTASWPIKVPMEQLSCQVLKKQNQTSDQFHEMNSVNFLAESLTWHPLTLKCVVVARWVALKHPQPCMAHELILRMIGRLKNEWSSIVLSPLIQSSRTRNEWCQRHLWRLRASATSW